MDYVTIASPDALARTVAALNEHHFSSAVVASKEEALEKIKSMIPRGASVMNGSSTTLQEIGYVDYLKSGTHGWNNLHEKILAETDQSAQALLRRQSVVSDYYVGSAHAVTETGELVFASNTGSQLPHLAFTSPNMILVVGTQKIVPTIQDAFGRISAHVVPLENARMQKAYGMDTTYAKTLILHKENPMMGRTSMILFVTEKLGF